VPVDVSYFLLKLPDDSLQDGNQSGQRMNPSCHEGIIQSILVLLFLFSILVFSLIFIVLLFRPLSLATFDQDVRPTT
jgi:hypothetical protein